ncbi:hypothetical protein [Palpita vitrealis nucleopolyhedrovirus]|uniref:Uncharacterized protein n=1 Tax=Palpita vitrealis nucleopolyhedrovirus TaxID=2951960 RepID=A0AAE9LNK6_9ABAC|nr:hypothetical protein [Palpita vitrealis nucleopolyhedrovirus]
MSILKVMEACELANIFYKLGYLYRTKVCLEIGLDNLGMLRRKTNIKQVQTMLNKKVTECVLFKQKVEKKIQKRVLIKIYNQ